jgi:hypothetical protein
MNGTQRPNLLAVDLGRKVAGCGDLARQHLTALSVDDAHTKQDLANRWAVRATVLRTPHKHKE